MDVLPILEWLFQQSPVAIAIVVLLYRGWLDQKADKQNQEANQLLIENQRKLRVDVERHSERKLKEERDKREALACRVGDLEAGGVEKDKTITALKKQVGNLTRDIQQRDKQISELAALIHDLTDAKDAQDAANKAKDKVIANLRVELDQVKRSRSEAVSEREAKIEKLEERLAKVEQVQKNGTDKLDPKVAEEKEADDKAA